LSTTFLGCPGLNYRSEYESGRSSTKDTVRELTSGEDRTSEQLRQAVEEMMLAAGDNRPDVRTEVHAGHENHSNVRVVADVDQTDDLLKRIRRDPDQYRDK
jgi:hypothetical protein